MNFVINLIEFLIVRPEVALWMQYNAYSCMHNKKYAIQRLFMAESLKF